MYLEAVAEKETTRGRRLRTCGVPAVAQARGPRRGRGNLRPPDADDITTAAVTDLAAARIRRRKILGGLIHEYERAA
jgi:hypothetical protein